MAGRESGKSVGRGLVLAHAHGHAHTVHVERRSAAAQSEQPGLCGLRQGACSGLVQPSRFLRPHT